MASRKEAVELRLMSSVATISITPVIIADSSVSIIEDTNIKPNKNIAVRIPPMIDRAWIVRLLFCTIPFLF